MPARDNATGEYRLPVQVPADAFGSRASTPVTRRMPLTPNEIGDKPHAGDKGYDFLQPMKAASYAQLWEEPPPY